MGNKATHLPNPDDAESMRNLRPDIVPPVTGRAVEPSAPIPAGDSSVGSESSLPNSAVSTWIVGRMLSRLSWELQLSLLHRSGWIKPFSNVLAVLTLDRLFTEISLVARGMVEAIPAKNKIQDALRLEWEAFWNRLVEAAEADAPRVFELLDANLSLLKSKQELVNLRTVHDGLCERLVSPGVALVERLFMFLLSQIGEVEMQALLLGKLVDQGLHSRDAYRLTYEVPEDFGNPKIDTAQPSHGSWWLATRRPTPGELLPSWEWFRQVQSQWEELGLDEPLPEDFIRFANGGKRREQPQDLKALIDSVARAALSSLSRTVRISHSPTNVNSIDPDKEPSEIMYLGAIFYSNGLVVGREGYKAKINLVTSKLSYKILRRLCNYRGLVCP